MGEEGGGNKNELTLSHAEGPSGEGAALAAASVAQSSFLHQAWRVLLVDDDPVTLRTVDALLSKFGYRVTTAGSGREAIQLLEASKAPGAEPIDLVLTDAVMPEVSGFDLVHEVVHGTMFSEVPVVVMSSADSQHSVLQAFEAGAADYLIKPLRRNEVATLWQHVWRANRYKASMQHAAAQAAGTACGATGVAQHYDPQAPAVAGAERSNAPVDRQRAAAYHPQNPVTIAAAAAAAGKNGSSGASTSQADQGSVMFTSAAPAGVGPSALAAGAPAMPSKRAVVRPCWPSVSVDPLSSSQAATHTAYQSAGGTTMTTGGGAGASATAPLAAQPHRLQQQRGQDVEAAATGQDAAGGQAPPEPRDAATARVNMAQSCSLDGARVGASTDSEGDDGEGRATSPITQPSVPIPDPGLPPKTHAAAARAASAGHDAAVESAALAARRKQEEEDAEAAEAAGLLLGMTAGPAVDQPSAGWYSGGYRNGSTMAQHPQRGGAAPRRRDGSAHAGPLPGTTAEGGHKLGGPHSGSTRSTFSALTVILPRKAAAGSNGGLRGGAAGVTTRAAAAAAAYSNGHSGLQPTTTSDGGSPPAAKPLTNGRHALPAGGSPDQVDDPAEETEAEEDGDADAGPAPACGVPVAPPPSIFPGPAPGAGQMMLPHAIMPLLAYSFTGLSPELAQMLATGQLTQPPAGPDASAAPQPSDAPNLLAGVPNGATHGSAPHQHSYPSVVVVAGRCSMMSSTAYAHRQAALQKYLEKKKNRSFKKKVRYESRKRLAEARPRVRGQFVKQDVRAAAPSSGAGSASPTLAGAAVTLPLASDAAATGASQLHAVVAAVAGQKRGSVAPRGGTKKRARSENTEMGPSEEEEEGEDEEEEEEEEGEESHSAHWEVAGEDRGRGAQREAMAVSDAVKA